MAKISSQQPTSDAYSFGEASIIFILLLDVLLAHAIGIVQEVFQLLYRSRSDIGSELLALHFRRQELIQNSACHGTHHVCMLVIVGLVRDKGELGGQVETRGCSILGFLAVMLLQ